MRNFPLWLMTALLSLIISACVAVQPPTPAADIAADATPGSSNAGEMAGMDHGDMNMMGSEVPFDTMFIDCMIEHHRGAITMAEQALEMSERPEVQTLAEAIIAAQMTEIDGMQRWREAWFPDLATSDGMEMDMGMCMEMGDMSVSTDENIPFDQRFLQAMISHHQGAVQMAEMALEMSEREEIRKLADNIIATQNAEIEQMRGWLQAWYNVTE